MTKEEKLIGKEFIFKHYNHHEPLHLIFVEIINRPNAKTTYDECSYCKSYLKKKIYVFVTKEDNLEFLFGSECVKEVFKGEVK